MKFNIEIIISMSRDNQITSQILSFLQQFDSFQAPCHENWSQNKQQIKQGLEMIFNTISTDCSMPVTFGKNSSFRKKRYNSHMNSISTIQFQLKENFFRG